MNFNAVIKHYPLWKFSVWVLGLALICYGVYTKILMLTLVLAVLFFVGITLINYIKVRWNLAQGQLKISKGLAYTLLILTSVVYVCLLSTFIYYVGSERSATVPYLTLLSTFVIFILEYILKISAQFSDGIQVKTLSNQQAKRWLGLILVILGASLIAIMLGVYFTNWLTIITSVIIFMVFTLVLTYYLRKYQVEE